MDPSEARKSVPAEVRTALWAAIVLWLAVVAIVSLALHRERQQALAQAQQQARSLSAVLEESTARTFDTVDVALAGLAELMTRHNFQRHDADLRAVMGQRLQYLPTVRAIYVIGPDGRIQQDTDYPKTPDVSLADRAYFRQYLERPDLQHALSEALQSRSGHGWFVASTRRIAGPEGDFRGVVVAAVHLDTVGKLFDKLQLVSGQSMALLQTDGKLLASFPHDDAKIGQTYAQTRLFTELLPRQRAGSFTTSGPPLPFERIVSYRALDSQPLVVVLATAESTVLQGWRRAVLGAGAGLLVFTGLLAAAFVVFTQRQEQKAQALADRAAQAEASALAAANAKFRTFFEQGCFLSCVLALDGTVLEANNAGLAACGYTRADVVGARFWDCAWWRGMSASMEAVQRGFQAARAGDTFRCEAAYSMADGRQTLVDLVLSPVRSEDGEVLSVAALAVDITERKLNEERLRTLAEELRNADRLKGEFLATLSHELRNVLAPMQNGLAILERVRAGSDRAVRAQELIARQFAQLRRLIDDLLDVSRVSAGKIRLQKERVDLRDLLAGAAESAAVFMQGPRHELTTTLPDAPLCVDVDRNRLLQVMTNLLSNAAKYTPPGGHIRLSARREGQEAIVEVADDGVGIPPAAQAKVFDMFEQVSGHLSRAQGGLGIGLALVQKLVALHDGHVEAYSEGANLGSTFTICLPLAQDASLCARPESSPLLREP
ncbi:ATP-binding protein [Ramlibacter sp. AN1133]|uniref:ATP-binding protein n=1 Tax=Ramlibacter sp. AN1133 TaxID=3133429 RepID=UPI0030BB17F4